MRLTPEQQAAVNASGKVVCVDAGAGSGKTHVLVSRVMRLLEQGDTALSEIAAITFTDKAALEMKARLRRGARQRAPLADSAGMTFWRGVERNISSARISTIHSFCMRTLKENALRTGTDPDFAPVPEGLVPIRIGDTVERTLHDMLAGGQDTRAAQRLVAEYGFRTLTEMLVRMLSSRIISEQALDAAPLTDVQALRDHWSCLVHEGCRDELTEIAGRLRGIEGACESPVYKREALRRDMLELVTDALDAIGAGEMETVLIGVKQLSAQGGSKKKWASDSAFDEVKVLLERLRDLSASKGVAAATQVSAELTCFLGQVYRQAAARLQEVNKAQSNLMFDDLILEALRVLRDNEEVRLRTAQGIKHLLIDEFQDTDGRQLEIARLLSETEGGPDLFIVGDAKQSIYRFRGADVDVFTKARKHANMNIALRRSFRTVPSVLSFVNAFFEQTNLLGSVELPYLPLEPHRCSVDDCRVELLLPACPEDGKPKAAEMRSAEAELIAQRIVEMCTPGTGVDVEDPQTSEVRPVHFGDIAILFSVMSNIHLYEAPLRRLGIPYTVVSGRGYYERQEVADLHSLLRVVIDPYDEIAALALLRSPIVGISDDALAAYAREHALSHVFTGEDLELELLERDTLAEAQQLLRDLRAVRHMPLVGFMRTVFQRTGYEAILLAQEFLPIQKALNVRKVADLANEFAQTSSASLADFVRYLDEMTTREVREGEANLQSGPGNAVTLLTAHKSKGLEFPIVFAADLARGSHRGERSPLFLSRKFGPGLTVFGEDGVRAKPPAVYQMAREEDILEEAEQARLLYVALTRARDRLVLSGHPSMARYKGSFLERIMDFLALNAESSEQVVPGHGWNAAVRRKPKPPLRRAKPQHIGAASQHKAQTAAAGARVRPAVVAPTQRSAFAVTELLHLMAEHAPVKPMDASGQGRAAYARLRGTLIHRVLELWNFVEDMPPDAALIAADEFPEAAGYAGLLEEVHALASSFAETELFKKLHDSSRILREQPFLLRLNGVEPAAFASGAIDVILDERVVADYKTGRRTADKQAVYEWQLLLYAAACRELGGFMPRAAYVCYLDEEEMVVPVTLTHERVEEAMERAAKAVRLLRKGTGEAYYDEELE